MDNKELLEKLTLLGYSTEWVQAGLLTEAQLNEQVLFYHSGEDPNLEHYHYKTFISYIDRLTSISNEKLTQILQLIHLESEESMAGSVLVSLLKKDYLSEEQFNKVSIVLGKYGEWTEKQFLYQRSRRENSNQQ